MEPMDELLVYIAADRRLALWTAQPIPDRAIGSVLFADISGFTALTDSLARLLGPRRGAEEVTRQINQIYNLLTAAVDRYGGSIVGFSGDAITCWFGPAGPGQPADLADIAHRTVSCALEMQAAMRRFASIQLDSGERVALAMKAAVASGPVRRFLVGDPQVQQIDALAGATLDHLAAIEHLAARGEVLIDQPTADLLGGLAQIVELRPLPAGGAAALVSALADTAAPAPWAPIPPAALAAEQLRPWVIPAVYARLSGGLGGFLAELRPAAMLFVNFSGIDYDNDEQAGATLDAYIRWVQAVLTRYDGTLLQLTIGDKGSYIYVAFGAPIAHENDAARAVGAALELRAPPPSAGLPPLFAQARIGVSRGMVYAGEYGGTTRRTYGVMGDEVNLAARLMQQARPGEVIVSERVSEVTDRLFSYRALGSVTVKGKSEPVPIFALLGRSAVRAEHPAAASEPDMVGRAGERARLSACLEALVRGEPAGPVLIVGDAGIGKSRLVDELQRMAARAGVRCLSGAGDAIERAVPYHAWRPLFSQLFGIDHLSDSAEARRAAVIARLEAYPDLLLLTPLLSAILPLELPESSLTAPMIGQVRADNIIALLTQLLRDAAAAGPLLLLIEDAQWLDSASWALLSHLATELPAALLVVTSRPLDAAPPPGAQRLRAAPGLIELSLGPLAAGDVVALVCSRLGVDSLPPSVAELIRERAEGNPFFSEELALALRDTGVLRVEQRGGQTVASLAAGDLSSLSLPDTVEGVITSRIDRLSPSLQLTLKVASVIGRIFTAPLLDAIHPVEGDRQQLPDQLDRMIRLELMLAEVEQPDLTYLFKHVITQEVAYNLMLFAQRRELHAAVARWHERHFADDLAPFYAVLAHHWLRAESPAQAMVYLEQAAAQSLSRGAFKEARDFYTALIDLTAEPEGAAQAARRRAHWMSGLAHAYRGLGMLAETRQYGEQVAAALDRPVPARPMAALLGQIGLQIGQRWLPGRFVRPPADADERADLEEVSKIYRELTSVYWSGNHPLHNFYVMLRRLNIAERLGPGEHLIESYGMMAFTCHAVRLHGLGRRYARRVEQAAAHAQAPLALALALNAASLGLMIISDVESVRRNTARTREIYQRYGDWRGWGESVAAQANLANAEGDYARCIRLSAELLPVARRSGNLLHQIWALLGSAGALLRLGRPAEAAAAIEEALPLCEQNADRAGQISSYGMLAEARLASGDRPAARRLALQTLDLIAPSPVPSAGYSYSGYLYAALVTLRLREEADPAEAAELDAAARRACTYLGSFATIFPYAHTSRQLCEGLRAWSAGRPQAARAALRRSLAVARRHRMAYEEGLTLYELGRRSPGPAGRAALESALAIFTRLDASSDIARAQAALDA